MQNREQVSEALYSEENKIKYLVDMHSIGLYCVSHDVLEYLSKW